MFLNHSRPLTEFVDEHYDMVLTAGACGSGKWERMLNTGHMLVRNSPTALTTLRSVWSLWNHTHCKYGEDQYVGGQTLCKVVDGRAKYYQVRPLFLWPLCLTCILSFCPLFAPCLYKFSKQFSL